MSICVVPFVVCLVLRSLRFAACRVFSGCISLGVKQVTERLGITSGGLLNLKLPEPDAMIGRTRGWLPETIDGWNAKRPGRGVGGGRPRKTSDWHTRWLRTNGLRFGDRRSTSDAHQAVYAAFGAPRQSADGTPRQLKSSVHQH